MGLNIPEILVANGTGMLMVIFLLLFRVRKQESGQMHERIFNLALSLTLAGLIGETISFLIDGYVFPGGYFLQYVCNFLCLGLMGVLGYLWCLFVDYRLYCNKKHLQKTACLLSIPLIPILLLLFIDLFGCGLIYTIDAENRYARGPLSLLPYIVLFLYLVQIITAAGLARKRGISPFFFPIYCFIIPCVAGAAVQGLFYGIATAWLSTAMASVFVYLELQTANGYLDSLSGLFNRPYMNYYLAQCAQHGQTLHGIMLDINDFKGINDQHGHTVGDRAIRIVGKILSKCMVRNAVAMRIGGDEFVILLSGSTDEACQAQIQTIRDAIALCNASESEPFYLSVSMGYSYFDGQPITDFLTQMDTAMYETKREYHRQKTTSSK